MGHGRLLRGDFLSLSGLRFGYQDRGQGRLDRRAGNFRLDTFAFDRQRNGCRRRLQCWNFSRGNEFESQRCLFSYLRCGLDLGSLILDLGSLPFDQGFDLPRSRFLVIGVALRTVPTPPAAAAAAATFFLLFSSCCVGGVGLQSASLQGRGCLSRLLRTLFLLPGLAGLTRLLSLSFRAFAAI